MQFDDTTTIYIPLWKKDGTVRAWSPVDIADYPLVSKYHWFLSAAGYASRHLPETPDGVRRMGYLHRDLFSLPYPSDGREVDHRDLNKLNNRRRNLWVGSHSDNMQNMPILSTNSSGYRGVSRSSRAKTWRAYIHVDNQYKHLGNFATKEEAAVAARLARENYFPGAMN